MGSDCISSWSLLIFLFRALVCSLIAVYTILSLNCMLQTEPVNLENDNFGYGFALLFSFAGSLGFIVVCFLSDEAAPLFSIMRNLFLGQWWYVEILKRGLQMSFRLFNVSSGHLASLFPNKVLHRRFSLVASHQAFLWHGQSILFSCANFRRVCVPLQDSCIRDLILQPDLTDFLR